MNLKDRVAVITGAASGIGRATALSLARRGCHLALADIDEAGLGQTQAQASSAGVRIVRGVERRRARILVGRDAAIISLMERLVPVNYWRVLGPRLR